MSIPIEYVAFCTANRRFLYLPTGTYWPRVAVDAACGVVRENGQRVQASDWIRQHAGIDVPTLEHRTYAAAWVRRTAEAIVGRRRAIVAETVLPPQERGG